MRFETREIQNLQIVLIKSLKTRFHFVLENDLFRAATFLHYEYKKFEFIEDANDRESSLLRAENEIHSLSASSSASASPSIPSNQSSKNAKTKKKQFPVKIN